jgi:hypothetical protein
MAFDIPAFAPDGTAYKLNSAVILLVLQKYIVVTTLLPLLV